jgi:glycosyltransferase involved in cell wall biosynthesis
VNVLIVSGIWPPDVGGPASHAPEVARFLLDRGHRIEVVVTADSAPSTEAYPIHWVSRSLPIGARHAEAVRQLTARARHADVVYTTGMFGRSAVATELARVPLVVKLTADPAYERARRFGLFGGELGEFQEGAPASTLPLRLLRTFDARRAAHLITPSAYLAELARGWGVPADRVSVLPNPAPTVPALAPRDELRRTFGFDGPTLVFAGRLTTQKSLELAIEAARAAKVELVVAGDGPDRAALERHGYGRFLGAVPRQKVLELFAASDAVILSSSWENFPHTVVEALAVGAPVIATRVGGVGEVVTHEGNGLLVESGDLEALTAAVRRFFDDAGLASRLRAAAPGSVDRFAAEAVYGKLEQILETAAR